MRQLAAAISPASLLAAAFLQSHLGDWPCMGIRIPASKLARRKAAASCRTPKLRAQSVGGVRRDNDRKDLRLDGFGVGWKPALRFGLGHCRITVGHTDIRLAMVLGISCIISSQSGAVCRWRSAAGISRRATKRRMNSREMRFYGTANGKVREAQ